MKIYAKRGSTNYKEKRLIAEIQSAISRSDVGELEGFPANSFEELKALHDKYVSKFDNYEEIKETKPENPTTLKTEPKESKPETASKPQTNDFIDPFNDAEPIVRDYVLSDGFKSDDEVKPTQETFGEPTSFEESFELPSNEDERGSSKQSSPAKEKKERKPEAPVNPRFDEMSDGKKRRSTKKLARMIVEGTSILAEKGCIWWTTKDITEDKLVQYELEDRMDLQILLTLDEGQQVTVREWFRQRVAEAQTLYKVSKEDKDDLIDSLYEVLLEKGVAPTPMQELMINAVKTFVLDMGLKAFAMQQQIKSVLTQLTVMHQEGGLRPQDVTFDASPTEEVTNPAVDETPVVIEEPAEVSETELQ